MVQLRKADVTTRIPPHLFFLVSAIFHYLGPAFAVLLFSSVSVLGVAWFRIASAAVVFAVWRRPWRIFAGTSWAQRRILLALGIVLGLMNACFYLAISRLPLGTVGAIEFLGPITLAALGVRTRRNIAALLPASAAIIGLVVLHQVPTIIEIAGILLVAGGVALHQEPESSLREKKKEDDRKTT